MEVKLCISRFIGIILFVLLYGWSVKVEAAKAILLHKNQNMASWNWLTRFEFGTCSGWSRDDNSGAYTVCDLRQTAANITENWLISEYVDLQGANDIHMDLEFTARLCPGQLSHCKQSFNIYVMRTNGSVVEEISEKDVHSGNFVFVDRVNGANLWTPGNDVKSNQVQITVDVSGDRGIYLAFQDQGACVALLSVTLSYNYCPDIVNDGALFKKTPAPLISRAHISVIGHCFNGASEYPRNSSISLTCLSSGQWLARDTAKCLCDTGYELVGDTCSECNTGYYKDTISNGKCVPCPPYSEPNSSRDSCPCKQGFYRAPKDASNESCSAPPSAPRDINISFLSDDIVMVAWSRPAFDGGRVDLEYNLHCSACPNTSVCLNSCLGARFLPAKVVKAAPLVIISNLNPEVLYNITVIARNGVSDQARNSSTNSLHTTFSFKRETTASPQSITTFRSTVTSDISTNGNLTITDAMGNQGHQNQLSSKTPTAIGISVAVTFIVCLIVAAIIIFFLSKYWKKKELGDHDVSSSVAHFSGIPIDATHLERLTSVENTSPSNKNSSDMLLQGRKVPSTTSMEGVNCKSRFGYSSRNDWLSLRWKNPLPAINIQDVNSGSNSNLSGDKRPWPLKKRGLPPLNWSPPRAISPVLMPRLKHPVSPSLNVDERNSPEGSESGRRSPLRNAAWFPEEEV